MGNKSEVCENSEFLA